MKRLLILIIVFSSIGIANAQWHFSITSMSYNDNCGSTLTEIIEGEVYVVALKQQATGFASQTYSTREECESKRSLATMNRSKYGCYIRTTTSPCTGGNMGGGNGIGSNSQDNASQFSSMAIGEPYFAPNEVYAVSSMGQDLEIKLEALNKGYNNAVNGIKTGDQSFDDIYRRQAKELPKPNNENNNDPYTFKPRNEIDWDNAVAKMPNAPKLHEDNDFSDGGSIIVPLDIERIRNQVWDERREKAQKRLDSIFNSKDTLTKPKDKKFKDFVQTFYDLASTTYDLSTGVVRELNDGVKMFELVYDTKIPGSDCLSEFVDYLDVTENMAKASVKAFIGNLTEAASDVVDQVTVTLLEPTSEVIGGMVTTGSSSFTEFKNACSDLNFYRIKAVGLEKSFENLANYMVRDGDPNKGWEYVQKELYNFGKDTAKQIYDRNKGSEPILIKQKDNEKE